MGIIIIVSILILEPVYANSKICVCPLESISDMVVSILIIRESENKKFTVKLIWSSSPAHDTSQKQERKKNTEKYSNTYATDYNKNK